MQPIVVLLASPLLPHKTGYGQGRGLGLSRGDVALAVPQPFQVLPRLLEACLAFHLCRVVGDDEADEGRVLETRFAEPADGSRLLVPGHDDAELMQKRCGLGVQGRGQRLGQAIERVALQVDHHEGPGVVRQLRQKPDRFEEILRDRRTGGRGLRKRGAWLIGDGGDACQTDQRRDQNTLPARRHPRFS